jgi:YVTN family beta-propeller protein
MRNFFVPDGPAAGWFRVVAAAVALSAPAVHADPLAYVPMTTSNVVDVVDLGSGKVVTQIPVGKNPMGIAFSPTASRVYVSNTEDDTVTVIDTANNVALGTITVGSTPMGLAVSPSGKQLAVATMGESASSPSQTITLYGTQTGLTKHVTVGSAPSAVAFNPAGSALYVANYIDGTITIVNPATLAAVGTITVGDHPTGLIVNAAGTLLYVQHGTGTFGPGKVTVVDLTKSGVIAEIRLNGEPNWFSLNPAGTRIVLAKPLFKTLSFVDTTNNTLLFDVGLPANCTPTSVSYSNDGKLIYVVCDGSQQVLVYDATTFTQLSSISLKGGGPTALGSIIAPNTSLADTPEALSGLWWNPSESGWGIHFVQRHGNIFASWFTYDANGKPTWYVASNCVMPASGLSCSGSVYQVTGPRIFGVTYDPSLRVTTAVGSLSVNFSDNDNALMSYTVNGVSRTVAIMREVFLTGDTGPAINFTDMWWNPAEPGWGAALTHQVDTIFIAWYVYDDNGKPIWYVSPNCIFNPDGMSCGGPAYVTTGPPFGPTFDTSMVTTTNIGYMRVEFSDGNNGTFSYLSQTAFVSKQITRMRF